MQQPERRPTGLANLSRWSATSFLVASSAALLTGCSVVNDVMTTVGMSTSESAPAPSQPDSDGNAMVVTEQQRAYLDALNAAGVRPSSDLMALRIGSYVCQARAAKQSDQAVWDVVVPLVRGDVRTAHLSSSAAAGDVDAATADYIRIATDRLC
ncbi:DUF732 domain-containing protein [Mycobacterium sp. 3519A]|uniref:DUF732 domain-containing protein n=1 Tax=Mycobacterium sp. 3519A TaxID=2057184 RepID=UPI000C7AF88A|nr:DUF732 domain-containing protein [Mycobacterium sp. 3519A]